MAKRLDVGALLGDTMSKLNTMQVREIPLDQLEENPDNSYAQTGIDELAESIEVIGLQQPLVVVPVEDGAARWKCWSAKQRPASCWTPTLTRLCAP